MSRKNWKCKKKEMIYEAKTEDEVSFVKERIELPSGHEFDYLYTHSPYEVVYIIALELDCIFLIKQYRYIFQEYLIELPAGSPNKGESLSDGAKRELLEETGLKCGNIEHMTTFYHSSGMTDQKGHLFLATSFEKHKQELELGEDIEIVKVKLTDALQMVNNGEIKNVGASYGILYLLSNKNKYGIT